MIRNIVRNFRTLFGTAAKVLLLLLACTALGMATVYPLWYFATSAPGAYTVAMLVIIAVAAVFIIARRIRAAGLMTTVTVMLRIAVVAAGIVSCVALVMHGRRLFALPVVLVAIVLYGVLSFGRDKR